MFNKLPEIIKNAAESISRLPSIGPRQAIRLVFYLINKGAGEIDSLAKDIEKLKSVKICERCFSPHTNQGNICHICSDKTRNHRIIMIVEKETDLLSIEETGKFKGQYFVLGQIPRSGMLEGFQKLRLQSLKNFITKNLNGTADEIILGFSPTRIGDFHSDIISKELAGFSKKISRLGRGLPTGGEIEFADDETLSNALENRH